MTAPVYALSMCVLWGFGAVYKLTIIIIIIISTAHTKMYSSYISMRVIILKLWVMKERRLKQSFLAVLSAIEATIFSCVEHHACL